MKVRRTIFDCDGVLADWTSYLLKKLDCGLTIDDCDDFSLKDVLKRKRGPETAKRMGSICSRPEFTASQPVFPWAREMIDLSLEAGEILVSTSPWSSKGWYDARIGWLHGNLGIPQDWVQVGRRKFWLKADLFVDDKPRNVLEWCADNPQGRGVLLAWPYNKEHPSLPSNARRLTPQELLEQLRAGFPEWT